MMYFRHLSTGRNGDRLKPIYAEFGKIKGYGLYFLLLEMCAEKYNGKQEKFVFLKSELLSELSLISSKLELLLSSLKVHSLIFDYKWSQNGKVVELWWPDLIEISDDYTKKVRQRSAKNPQNVAPKDKDINRNKSINNNNPIVPFPDKVPYQEIFDLWNRLCQKLPKAQKLTDKRKKAIKSRWSENTELGIMGWADALTHLAESNFCNGDNNRTWVADFDFFIKPDTITKCLEGKYANRIAKTNNQSLMEMIEKSEREEREQS